MDLQNLYTPDFLLADHLIDLKNRLFIVETKTKSLVEAIYLDEYFSLQINSIHNYYEYVNSDGLTEKWLLATHYSNCQTDTETKEMLNNCWTFYTNYLAKEDNNVDSNGLLNQN